MQKHLSTLSARLILLFVVCCVLAADVRAQCSASIPSGTKTVCAGGSVTIPITFTGTAPFTYRYVRNGSSLGYLVTSEPVYNLVLENFYLSSVIEMLSMTDASGCQGALSGTVAVQVIEPIVASISKTLVTCSGNGLDGALTVGVDGGIAPFTYAWSSGLPGTSVVQGLATGTYTVTVTDANGCSTSTSTVLGLDLPVISGIYPNQVFCAGLNNGSINIIATSPNLTYAWSNGATTEDLSDLSPGTYTVTITNTSGCTRVLQGTVNQTSTLSLAFASVGPTCGGNGNGTIGLTVTGGTPAYTYIWSNGATTQNLSNLNGGTYRVTVTDANGCTKTGSTSLSGPPAFYVYLDETDPTCGNNDGSIDLNISGGTGPYQALWSNGSTEEDLTNLSSGTYSVTVTDVNGCTRQSLITIDALGLSVVASSSNCLANLDLGVSAGTPPYTYQWSNNATTEDITGLSGGTYTVTVTDSTGCTSSRAFTVGTPTPISTYINVNNDPCGGYMLAHVPNSIGCCQNTFLWSTGVTGSYITNLAPGTYTVTATSAAGCTATASITRTLPVSNSEIDAYELSSIHPQCNGEVTGSIRVDTSDFSWPPFNFSWSTGSTASSITNLAAGIYTVTISDAHGCSKVFTRTIEEPPPFVVNSQVNNSACNIPTGAINLDVYGGTTEFPGYYTYLWSDGATAPDRTNLGAGIYQVTITDAMECTYVSPDIAVEAPFFAANIEQLSAQCNSSTLKVNFLGGQPPYSYNWQGPHGFIPTSQIITVSESGTYEVYARDANNCYAAFAYEVVLAGDANCGYIGGTVFRDEVENCLPDAGEPGLGGWLVRAESLSDTFYGVTDAAGRYAINVSTGTYTMVVLPANDLWEVCPISVPVTVDTPNDTVPGGDFPVKVLYECPYLTVSLGSSNLRRCFTGNAYYISYCNDGTTAAEDAYLLLALDPYLNPLASNVPYTDIGGGVLRFNLGDVEVQECGSIQLQIHVSCSAEIGQAHCSEAHIYPDGNCLPTNPNWSGASVNVTSECAPDSVRFKIKNVGINDMQTESEYIVVEDAVMRMRLPFQLDMGDSTLVAVPANGSTWRMEVDQEPFHPGLSFPAITVEACSENPSFSTGYVSQFFTNDEDAWVDIECSENSGAWDPNDKRGFPVGYSEQHYVHPGKELEYTIRFQNTGTDTAFTVRILDTLSSRLDPATIRPMVSSHSYRFNLTGAGIAAFLFENILLPDSNVNQAGSNGFVKFSIYPRADAPLETLIENSAAIYFDFNEPVITNTTRHRLGENFLMVVNDWQPRRPNYEVSVSPNPFNESVRLEVKDLTSSQPIHLQVFDLQGKMVYEETASGPVLHLKKGSLKTGLYLFKLDQKGTMIGNGKLMVRE